MRRTPKENTILEKPRQKKLEESFDRLKFQVRVAYSRAHGWEPTTTRLIV